MQITITVPDKLIKSAIDNTVDSELYEYFDSAVLKAAKLPKSSTLVNKIFADEKFQAKLEKTIQGVASEAAEDLIFDMMYDIKLPGVDDLVKQCQDVMEARSEELEAAREAEEMQRLVKTLEKAGFKIVKA